MPRGSTPPTRQALIAADLRRWFTAPPRAHGERDPHRVVSFVELFYDLVFVVLVGQMAHALVGHITWLGVAEFTVVYGLIWLAWLNGSLYYDLRGREDGRTRSFIFAQMTVLVWLAVNAGHAISGDAEGRGFGIVYGLLLVLLARQWWLLRRVDTDEQARRNVFAWVLVTLGMGALVVVGGFTPEHIRIWLWAGAIGAWVIAWFIHGLTASAGTASTVPTESLAERFGLYTIIVLGEVVVGVVDGLMSSERSGAVLLTGFLALGIGFGFWWNYFDAIGRRLPRPGRAYAAWVMLHLPLTAAIAAAGAGMVSLIEHGDEAHTPSNVAWLLAIASASLLVWLALIVALIDYGPVRAAIRTKIQVAYAIGAVLSVVCGWWAPTPWLLAGALTAVHAAIWVANFSVLTWQHTSVELAEANA